VHKRAIKAWDADPEVVEKWIKYIRLHAMDGVGIKVTRWEHMPVGVGQTMLRDMELELGKKSPAEEIKELGETILKEEMAQST
jgi:small subunit ribosomal protein S10